MDIISFFSFFLKPNNTGKVARNALFLSVSELILKAIGVLWVVYLARTFSVGVYGEYNLVTSFIAIFSFLPDFGVGLIVIREIARDRKNAATYLGSSVILNGLLSIITFVAIVTTAFLAGFDAHILPLIIISSITLVVSTLRSVAIFYFDGVEKMHYSASLNTLNTILLVGGALVGSLMGFGLPGVFYGMLAGTIVSLIVSWYYLLQMVKPRFLYDSTTIYFYLRQGAPLGIASLASLIYMHIDVLVLSRFLGERAVGLYSAATPFAFAVVQLLNVPFVVAVYPALSRLEKESKNRFKKGILKSVGIIALWSIPVSLSVSLLSPIVIPLIFGRKYDQAIPLLQILIFLVPFISISALLYKVLIIVGKQKDYLFISILGALLNIALNVSLIPMFGIHGAVYAAILTQVVLLMVYSVDVYIRVHKKTK